jgi:hypothetical protein
MRKWRKSGIGLALGAVLGPAILSMPLTPSRAEPPSLVEAKTPSATNGTGSPTAGPELKPEAGLLREELELLGLQVETERAQLRIAESRLEQAKRWESYFSDLVAHGRAPTEKLIAAKDSVLTKESDVAAEKAELRAAEIRLARAKRGTSAGRSHSAPSERRLADVERRLEAMERSVRSLRHETERIGLDLPIMTGLGR